MVVGFMTSRIEDLKPRKKSLLSSLFKNVKHALSKAGPNSIRQGYQNEHDSYRHKRWQEKNKKIETLTPSNLVKIKALKARNKRSRIINSMIGQLSDARMINKLKGLKGDERYRLGGWAMGTRFKVHSKIKKPLL